MGRILAFTKREIIRTTFSQKNIFCLILLSLITFFNILSINPGNNPNYNIWNGIFSCINHHNFLSYVYTPLFLYLISDVIWKSSTNSDILYQIRLKQRYHWWLSKTLTILVNGLIYTLIIVFISLIMSFFVFNLNLEWHWSSTTISLADDASRMALHFPKSAIHILPLQALLSAILLLFLGWSAMGLLSGVITLLVNNGFYGAIIAYIIFIGSNSILGNKSISFITNLHIDQHFFIRSYMNPNEISILFSFIYWVICFYLFYTLGQSIVLKKDFLDQLNTKN
ncbi:hypothetical protein EDC19_2312 [Natranaerovirga hydrolytica]|uniref:ABC-2 type transport system permease protein n=1 Tax=Natranaerovirga hydrolytica TaxID=680378 RepID=A0A4R1ML47_9FIRM|nr:hypothetical protein [Natranaerovirga hydrolytica]TCK90543.1 hypothetical protein EDC19_2312 [Natranaerovirga hydrolytica]